MESALVASDLATVGQRASARVIDILVVLLLVAIGAAAVMSWDRRSGEHRRESNRGGRRTADGAEADVTEPTAN